jgi:RNA polymerase sigma factor (sigma-70 family)
LHSRIGVGPLADQDSDGRLLLRFVRERDQAAFATLMHRHGPMVLGVCRRVLRDANDADDAFQATFLVLVRKAASLRQPELLGNWLYGVAYRTAIRARVQLTARRRREECVMQELAAPSDDAAEAREFRFLLDDELNRLPERFRRPFVLCKLGGLTNEEAARRLGCPKGTVLSRLARARERLRRGLERRGVTLTATAMTALLAQTADAAVPVVLFGTTLASARVFVAGSTAAGGTLGTAGVLAEGVLQNMFMTKLKATAAMLLLMAVVGSSAGMLMYGSGSTVVEASSAQAKEPKDNGPAKKDDKKKPPPAGNSKPAEETANAKKVSRHKQLIDRLADTVQFDGYDDPRFTLQDALDHLADRYDLAFQVDEASFSKEEDLKGRSVLAEPICATPLPKMPKSSLDTVLRKILSRLPVKSGSTFIVRRDFIEITTVAKAKREAFRDWSVDAPLVNAVFDKRPLSEAVEELIASSGVNLVIDTRIEEKAKTAVTATLTNVPLDSAIRVLADMADLQPAFLDNVIYLTTKEKAERLQKEATKRLKEVLQ